MFAKVCRKIVSVSNLMTIIGLLVGTLLLSSAAWASGVLDTTFGNGGKATISFGNTTDVARAAALQPDGKIVLAGNSYLSGQGWGFSNFAVARLNTDGTPDVSFGTSGKVTIDFNGNEDAAHAVIIQPDGKIVVGGYRQTNQSHSSAFALARYNPDGSLDTSFGNNGKVVTDFEESAGEKILTLMLRADGKIVAAGSYSGDIISSITGKIALVRYNADGSLDAGFGVGGKFTVGDGLDTSFGSAALQPDGKIILAGRTRFRRPNCTVTQTNSCESSYSFLFRYNSEMGFDRKFGRRFGKEFGNGSDTYTAVLVQSDKKIALGMVRITGLPYIKRYSQSGHLEREFSQAIFPGNGSNLALAQRPDGSLVGCGHIGGGQGDMGVGLFSPDGNFIGSDRRDFFGGDDNCMAVLTQPDGKILAAGVARADLSSTFYRFAVVRYLDIAP